MEEFINSCVGRFSELSGNQRAREFPTPFIPESHEESPAGAPYAKGPVVERLLCRHTFPPAAHQN
eukprot:7705434-Alexandrium_andersonii.AAC.1